MNTKSMLADVFASANEKLVADDGEKGAATTADNQQTEIPMSDKTTAAAAQPKTETVDDLKAAYPALCGQIASDAAKAERERIQGIMGLPAAGHGKIVEAAVADGKSTKADVALAILEAERATRAKVMDNLKAAESEASVVAAAPSAQGEQGKPKQFAQNPDGWKAEYENSAELQAEFSSANVYVAFKKAEASGQARRLTRSA